MKAQGPEDKTTFVGEEAEPHQDYHGIRLPEQVKP